MPCFNAKNLNFWVNEFGIKDCHSVIAKLNLH